MPEDLITFLRSPLTTWSAAYLGCTAFFLADIRPQGVAVGWSQIPLFGALSWLTLIGSAPIALVLGAAKRLSQARRFTFAWVATASIVGIVAAFPAWRHAAFLLSGPTWVEHPRRELLRVLLSVGIMLLAACAWSWVVAGYRGRRRTGWMIVTIGVCAATAVIIGRYRAYDYSVAQLILVGAVLAGAAVDVSIRESRYRPASIALAALVVTLAVIVRFNPETHNAGAKLLVQRSRIGSLSTLYLMRGDIGAPAMAVTLEPCVDHHGGAHEPMRTGATGPPESRSNVIVVSVDALRKDVIGKRIGGREVTPELTRKLTTGISFQNATTTYPATLFAIGSAFTGLSPAELFVSRRLPPTIFELSRKAVDRQIAVLPDVSWFRLPIVEEFFVSQVETSFAKDDSTATDILVDRLEATRMADDTVMAWVHYYSPHEPYEDDPQRSFGRGTRNAYLDEVARFDREFGRLMQYLEETGWLEDSLVVFFSDHGEALGERSYWGHHVYLNSWMIDIPLALWHQDLRPSKPTVGVSLTDVAPTILDFLALPIPERIGGESLFALDPTMSDRSTFAEAFPIRGRELFESLRLESLAASSIRGRLKEIRVLSEGYEPKAAVTRGARRLVRQRASATSMLFDRENDPAEVRDLSSSEPETTIDLEGELIEWEREQLRRIHCRLGLH